MQIPSNALSRWYFSVYLFFIHLAIRVEVLESLSLFPFRIIHRKWHWQFFKHQAKNSNNNNSWERWTTNAKERKNEWMTTKKRWRGKNVVSIRMTIFFSQMKPNRTTISKSTNSIKSEYIKMEKREKRKERKKAP